MSKSGVVTCNESETVTLWLPCESGNGVLDFDNLDRDGLFAHTEYLEIAVCSLLCLGETVDLDTQIIAAALPVKFTL